MMGTDRFAGILALAALTAAPVAVYAQDTSLFDLPSQSLADSLKALSSQTNTNVLVSSDLVDGKQAPALKANVSVDAALQQLLRGSGLKYKFISDKTVVLAATGHGVSKVESEKGPGVATTGSTFGAVDSLLHVAQVEDGGGANSSSSGSGAPPGILAEVIVTAQKREERLQDVPVPVTALSGEVLTQFNQLRLQDYYNKVPGLNLQFAGDGDTPTLSIRGINNGNGGAPTVGVVVDDVPYGSTTGSSRGQPDIDPGELARVEILRGPQGTLYGANSMGGLLRFVTIDPSTDKLSGRIQVGTSDIRHGTGNGYNFRGSINVPVSETMAFRASAFRDQTPGYINNVQTGQKGINSRTSEGGRFATLWKPSEDFSLKLSALLQHSVRDGTDASTVGSGFKELQIRAIPNSYAHDDKTQAYSATLNAKLGNMDLVSLTGFNVDHFALNSDLTNVSGGFFNTLSEQYLGVSGSELLESARTRRFSQELRLSMPLGDRVTWLLGGYYTDEQNVGTVNYGGANPLTGTPTDNAFIYTNYTVKYAEYAGFTNLQYNITDQFDVQLGGRLSRSRETSITNQFGPVASAFFCTSAPTGTPCPSIVLHAKDTPFTYLFTPRYKISPDLMIYARLASGYRPGGANITCNTGIPCDFKAEKTKNYEVGFKGDLLDHLLSFDASLYRIDWTNIVVELSQGQISYSINGGKAKSQGVELSMDVRPFQGMTIAAWVAWNDAKFKDGFPTGSLSVANIRPGDRLPYGSRVSGSLSADQEFVVNGPLTAFVGGSVTYVGDRLGAPQPLGSSSVDLPAYAQTDLHVGLKYENWTTTAFVNNVTDKRGVLAGGIDYQYLYPDPNTFSFIQPRTIGLNVSRTF